MTAWTAFDIGFQLLRAFFIICCWTIVYKSTFWFNIPQYILIGAYGGFLARTHYDVIISRVINPLFVQGKTGNIWLWIVFLLGILYILRNVPQIRWVSMYPISTAAAIGMGMLMRLIVPNQIIKLVSMRSWTDPTGIILTIGIFTVLYYFLFTFRRTGPAQRGIAGLGRYFIMIALGMTTGTYFISCISFIVGHMYDLTRFPMYYIWPPTIILLIYSLYQDYRG
jgi:hypothetical protein